jgi:c-di-GMP-binding flagellar brake protein YcgR
MISELITLGDKLELKKLKTRTSEEDTDKIYVSQLLDISQDDKLNIAMPIEKGRIIPLSIGDKYSVRFYTNKGLYQCKAVITDRYRNNNIFILVIQLISELEKHQRRQYYRLECLLDIKYHVITDLELAIVNKIKRDDFKDDDEKQKYLNTLEDYQTVSHSGTIVDLSGGGARFISNHKHEHGNRILISIRFNTDFNNLHVINAGIISSTNMMNRQGVYEHRVQFNDITKEEREAIIKFIFEEDRKQRRKEKGLD